MVIAYILVGLATIFMFEIFQSLRDLHIAQASVVHYINISEPLPQIRDDTLTSSIRRRVIELFGTSRISDVSIVHSADDDISSESLEFYHEHMKSHLHKLSNALVFQTKYYQQFIVLRSANCRPLTRFNK